MTSIAAPTIPSADPNTRSPAVKLPPGSTDCHAHIFGPQQRYPYQVPRRYTPHDASLTDYIRLAEVLGLDRGVLVQPSVYASDNSLLLDALAENRFPLRGIVVVEDDVTDAELARMNDLGVRGIRLNLRFSQKGPKDAAPAIAERIAPLGWHVQFRINAGDIPALEPLVDVLPTLAVVDHIGQVAAEEGIGGKSFQALIRLLKTGRCWVKLSAPMRMSNEQSPPYSDVTPFVRTLVDTAPDALIWGMDWPHTTLTKPMPNDGDLVDILAEWIPDEAIRQQILVDNPARLFGFE